MTIEDAYEDLAGILWWLNDATERHNDSCKCNTCLACMTLVTTVELLARDLDVDEVEFDKKTEA